MAQLDRAREERHQSFQKLLATIRTLPPEQQRIELDKLQRDVERQEQANRDQETIDAQREVANALNDLTTELQQRRY